MVRQYLYRIIATRPRNLFQLLIKVILVFLSFFYLAVVNLRLAFYSLGVLKSVKLKRPTISIGNITWGGTGKTPLVEAVCSYLFSQGKKVCLLIRGYGSDEDKALKENLPGVSILVGRDRLKNAIGAERGILDIFVLDDGFQHVRIKRDLDIVTINAANPFGDGLLIPAGILREPISHLRRADLVVLTKSDLVNKEALVRLKEDILKAHSGIEIFEAIHKPLSIESFGKEFGLGYIKRKKVCAVSALGDNNSFLKILINLGADVGLNFFYLDHHRYSSKDIDKIIKACKQNSIDTIVTTEKDWVKIKDFVTDTKNIVFLILKIRLKIDDEEDFFRRVSSILHG